MSDPFGGGGAKFVFAVRKFQVDAIARAERIRKAVSKDFLTRVINDTPVDTGRLQANWVTTHGTPSSLSNWDHFIPGAGPAVAAMSYVVDNSPFGATVFMVNNLDYAHAIEYDGRSYYKAPDGMVRRNLARYNVTFNIP